MLSAVSIVQYCSSRHMSGLWTMMVRVRLKWSNQDKRQEAVKSQRQWLDCLLEP